MTVDYTNNESMAVAEYWANRVLVNGKKPSPERIRDIASEIGDAINSCIEANIHDWCSDYICNDELRYDDEIWDIKRQEK